LILLVHGLTGDEKVMWVFARRLPRDSWVLAPRGRVKSPQGGYGWFQSDLGISTGVEEYLPSADALAQLVRDWPGSMGFQPDQTGLIGFSQGAALTYTFALTHPELVDSSAGLAGFVPPGAERYAANRPLQGKRVFIAHGLRDETVPVAKALQAVELMQAAGAVVTYCESDVGHKLGADCLRGLEYFFAK
jgi:phospholipase/carboxylesterase